MTQRWVGQLGVLLLLAAHAVPTTVFAQANDEVDVGVQFNLSLPGARSLAMGGAFLASADDATAAYTNPAGLTILRSPEASLEGRYFRFESEFIVGGHAPGEASGVPPDTRTGLAVDGFVDGTLGASFASVVLPRDRWSFALYRHELASFETHADGGGEFVSAPGCEYVTPEGVCRRVFFRAGMDVEITSFGASAAYRFGDAFSFGVSVAYYDAFLSGRTDRYNSSDPVEGVFHDNPPRYDAANRVATTIQHIDDGAVAGNLGFVWKPADWLSVGAVWRRGPRFAFEGTVIQGEYLRSACPGCFHDVSYGSHYHVPDVYGVGLAFRPARVPLRVALDVNRVRYSQLMHGFVNIVSGIANDESFARATPDYDIDDATEIRLGAEYVVAGDRVPVALRVGGWLDPDHRLRNTGAHLPSEKTRFAGGEDELHVTAGVGLVMGKRLQLDAAFDHSDLVDTASLSAVFFF